MFPWNKKQPPTAEQLGLDLEDDVVLPVVLINDGRVLHKNLLLSGKDDNWLQKTLRKEGFTAPAQVFLLTLDEQNRTFFIAKEGTP